MILENYKSGNLIKSTAGYKYFLPTKINEEWIWQDQQISKLLEKSAIKLGELNSFSKLVPNIDLFIHLHINKEAVISSRIEGTKTEIDESFLSELEILPERRDDWQEVANYTKAINQAILDLQKLPISSRLIKKTHSILLDSVRGQEKQPGNFRTSQNWIGGSSPFDATFVPPSFDYVEELMSDLEKFIHNDEINVPDLIKIAIIHYQFETIHPFLDGNGRIGRLLITLFLVEKKILTKPLLYLSAYFEENKSLYYDNLTFVRTKNDMKQWLKYFLVGIEKTATKSAETLSKVLILKSDLEKIINKNFGKKSSNAITLLNHLFEKPSLYVKEVEEIAKLTYKSANDLVDDFVKAKILEETTGRSRNRIFVFRKYFDLFK
jgi:Fic family protein